MQWPETKITGQVEAPGPHPVIVEALEPIVPMEHHLPPEVVEATTEVVCLPLEATNQEALLLVEITAVLRAAPVPEVTAAVVLLEAASQVEATGVQVVVPEARA